VSIKNPLIVDYFDWTKLIASPPILNSFQADWRSIQLAHYRHSMIDLPEISNSQHVVLIPVGHGKVDFEFIADGCSQTVSYREHDYANGYIEIYPAHLPISLHSHPTVKTMEIIQCYLDPKSLAETAHESVNPDRVELLLTLKKQDLLVAQIGRSLRSILELDVVGSRFYAESMTTALFAHLLQYYSTRCHQFREYKDGLSKCKLKQAIDYIQTHLGDNLSLNDIAGELSMSPYYFSHLFKQSTGMSPHKYLIHQRVERAKLLLKQTEKTITSVAMECGFANQSHFAKCFAQYTGMNPKHFRNL